MVEFVHQGQKLAQSAWRKALPRKSVQVVAGQVGDHAPLVFAIGHGVGHQ